MVMNPQPGPTAQVGLEDLKHQLTERLSPDKQQLVLQELNDYASYLIHKHGEQPKATSQGAIRPGYGIAKGKIHVPTTLLRLWQN